MNSYTINAADFPSEELYQELQKICGMTVDKISAMSPSDNNVILSVLREGDRFLATIKVSSQEITLYTKNLASSPFMAIAAAASTTMDKVQKWSAGRTSVHE